MPFALHQVTKVSDLINHTDLRWKAELVKSFTTPFTVKKLCPSRSPKLPIPYSNKRVYQVKRAYQLLRQDSSPREYRQSTIPKEIWNLLMENQTTFEDYHLH